MSVDHFSSSANKVLAQTKNDLAELSSLKSTSYNKRGAKNQRGQQTLEILNEANDTLNRV